MDGMHSQYRGETLTEFAPCVPFRDLDLDGSSLPDQFRERIYEFYLRPARVTAKANYAFAAGLLVGAAIEALSRLARPDLGVGQRFVQWMSEELSSFRDKNLARRFYRDFRNGLVHECRIGSGSRFSLDSQRQCVKVVGEALSINVTLLIEEVVQALERFVRSIKMNPEARLKLSNTLRSEFAIDLALAGRVVNAERVEAPDQAAPADQKASLSGR